MKETFKNLYRFFYKEDLIEVKVIKETCSMTPEPIKTNNDLLYEKAKSYLGIDASPSDLSPDEYACMETVDTIYHKCFGEYINSLASEPFISTYKAYLYLKQAKHWKQVEDYQAGDLILSPSGFGNGMLSNGHVGICGLNNIIMSNNSNNGKWEENYTITTWKARYSLLGGFPLTFWRRV